MTIFIQIYIYIYISFAKEIYSYIFINLCFFFSLDAPNINDLYYMMKSQY